MYSPIYGKSRALVIGINKYEKVSPLGFARQDAEALARTLVQDLSFEPDSVTLLLDEAATKAALLRHYLSFCHAGTNEDDRLIIFFAGHGHTERSVRGEVGFLVPCDGTPLDLSTLIRWDELTRNADMILAKHILFLMDACYGGLAVTRATRPGSMRFLQDMLMRTSRQVLTAGKADEVVADLGGPVPGHSIFTGHLLQALSGEAKDNQGNLTAAGVTAYVYQRVSSDADSHQTPHFGHLQGDGDMIFYPLQLQTFQESEEGTDLLYSIPTASPSEGEEPMNSVELLKDLIPEAKNRIRLFDLIAKHTRDVLTATAEDYFPVQGYASDEIFRERISLYETSLKELMQFEMLLGYWIEESQTDSFIFTIRRLAERLYLTSGNTALLNLRWYPIELLFYAGGIGALASQKYSNLYSLMKVPTPYEQLGISRPLVFSLTKAFSEVTPFFKKLSGHERNHVPRSEYLFKLLQPIGDDVLFLGAEYENIFDRFEMLYALQFAHEDNPEALAHTDYIWAPVGRFGWKSAHRTMPPLQALQAEANKEGPNWKPLQAGLFGGKLERFNTLSESLKNLISRHPWF